MIKTSMLNKISEVEDRSQEISDFLEWIWTEKKYFLATYHRHNVICYNSDTEPECGNYDGRLETISIDREQLLADYFGIDLNKAEEEKRAMLKQIRKPSK